MWSRAWITCFLHIAPGVDTAAFSRSRCFLVVPVLTANTAGCVPAELTYLDRWRFVLTASNTDAVRTAFRKQWEMMEILPKILFQMLSWQNYRSFWWSLLIFSDQLWKIVMFENLNGCHLQLIGSQKCITLVIVAWDYYPKLLGALLAANICRDLGGWISLCGQFVGKLGIPWGGPSCISMNKLSYKLLVPSDRWLRKPLSCV